ncbi:MAG TPA: TonB-dependent receptor [Terriglobales bacterium]|nr:TonB-dependent receptor [Terriglobales bacterium]
MPISFRGALLFSVLLLVIVFFAAFQASAQTFGSIQGTVTDPSSAVVPGATVEIHNPVSGFSRSVVTDGFGRFSITNVPFNPYHLSVTVKGFSSYSQDVDVRSAVPVNLAVSLKLTEASETVTVEAGAADLIETEPTFHTDVDRDLIAKMPLESVSSDVSSLVTLTSPGVSADSNGMFHGLGDHAENSFSVDGQPITDQQSKTFSNQIPLDSIQSMEVISGAPPAEYGDKTSVVINVTTRSGQGQTTPRGSITTSYGSFGTSNLNLNLGYGGSKWGNFISVSGLNTGRFLDPPEFAVIHAKGNQQNAFDRLDFQLSDADSVHLNLGFTRSWFQTPNSFDNLNIGVVDPVLGNPVGAQDQRSQIRTFNISPSWTRLLSTNSVFTLGAFVRHDQYNYYPSDNPFADFGPLQQETFSQLRLLTNVGLRSDLSYTKNGHNLKIGAMYQHSFLSEHDNFGIVDPGLNAPCLDTTGAPVPGFTDPSQCAGAGLVPNNGSNFSATVAVFQPFLGCFDLTRPSPAAGDNCATETSTLFPFRGHADIKELALYAQDAISKGNWTFNVGVRGDFYNGFSSHNEAEPRLGVAYNIKQTGTVLRVSYARLLETPFNENLVISATGCNFDVIAALVPCVPASFSPGWRNEFHAGLEQAFGKYLVFSGEYVTKYTHNAYDFSVLGATPLTFPIEWHNSKIPGVVGRVTVPNYHGFTAQFVFSSVAARFFPPQIGGLGVTVGQSGLPFRIDHDEAFNQTTHLQYQIGKRGPWIGWNWRYDSGQVAGSVPFAIDGTTPVDLTGLTADQQIQAGLRCGSVFPTLNSPLTTCAPSQFGSTRISIPAPGTENGDHNPPRIAPRHLFDAALGEDNLFNGDRYKWGVRFTVINLTNKEALYNFLSTFSGTHFVTPRSYTAALSFNF